MTTFVWSYEGVLQVTVTLSSNKYRHSLVSGVDAILDQ